MKKPWERRLMDLAQLLDNCASTYFDPDLFRMNTNQFLQTARTVTFIIQKNKGGIPDFDAWYESNVVQGWKSDEVMVWAKDSRNTIEKQGDLELYSSLRASLVFSYLEEQDISVECGRSELLAAGVKKLVRLARKRLPTGASDVAAVKIERMWITASLPAWELLHALNYVYSRIYDCCYKLGQYLGDPMNERIPEPSAVSGLRERARRIGYVKLRDLRYYLVTTERRPFDPAFVPPKEISDAIGRMQKRETPRDNLRETVNSFAQLAKATFDLYGYHLPMLMFFDRQWRPIDLVSTEFGDQADKYIFWRIMADRAASEDAHAIVWIAESWVRDMSKDKLAPMRNMPIVGERLHVVGIDKEGNRECCIWSITRSTESTSATLTPVEDEEIAESLKALFHLAPVMRVMGLPDPDYVARWKQS